MEKYYCDHCRLLFDYEEICPTCGQTAKNKIIIELHYQEASDEFSEK